MTGIFIAATGTDMGKTHLCAQLLQRGRQDKQPFWISKPIISGWPADEASIATMDTAILLQAAGLPVDEAHIQATSPWRLSLPQTPDMAAKAANTTIDLDELLTFCRERTFQAAQEGKDHLIETAGGLMSPINGRYTNLEWIKALNYSCILLTGSYLGALSHTLTAWNVLLAQGICVLALVVNETPGSTVALAQTCDYLTEYVAPVPVMVMPWQTRMLPAIGGYSLYDLIFKKGAITAKTSSEK